jgi:hypothetical protein
LHPLIGRAPQLARQLYQAAALLGLAAGHPLEERAARERRFGRARLQLHAHLLGRPPRRLARLRRHRPGPAPLLRLRDHWRCLFVRHFDHLALLGRRRSGTLPQRARLVGRVRVLVLALDRERRVRVIAIGGGPRRLRRRLARRAHPRAVRAPGGRLKHKPNKSYALRAWRRNSEPMLALHWLKSA